MNHALLGLGSCSRCLGRLSRRVVLDTRMTEANCDTVTDKVGRQHGSRVMTRWECDLHCELPETAR